MLKKKEYDETYHKKVKWWVEKAQSYPGLLSERGWGNGYAVVPKGHPLYKVQHVYASGHDLDVNSEITFAGWRVHNGKEYWVIGFDTAHYGDSILKWPKEAVVREAINFAEQIKKINVK
jgi:hypothetical protein